ncbi:DUF4214 domain-containing protein [Massilia agilis]|uniref:DUF4214 domain-containing protein n=1 Tax=Massilia agilis TaxID=1811226 RepID=A0ABT2DDZ9_9BURK|nr:DUF4214 domain-containing protein [Massilia agilis]MCS0809547.1 DUF4214 domain-containing protein [Massilia agilis]
MAIVFGQDQQFTLTNGGSANYQLEVTSKGGAIAIKFTDPAGSGSGGEQVWVTLKDAAQNVVFSQATSTSQLFKTTVPSAGTYQLTIEDRDPTDAHDARSYTINASLDAAPGTVYDGPINDTMATALPALLTDRIVGTLGNGDVDVFKVSAGPGQLKAVFGHPSGTAGGAPIKVDLLDDQGRLLTTKTLGQDASFDATMSAPGDFYLRVLDPDAADHRDGGYYTFSSSLSYETGTVYDGASDTDAAHAQALPLSRVVEAEMHHGDQDFYRLDVPAAGKLTFNFVHTGGNGVAVGMELLDASGSVVFRQTVASDTDFTVNLAAGGAYTVRAFDADPSGGDAGIYCFMTGFSSAGGDTMRGAPGVDARFTSSAGNDTFIGYSGRDAVTFRDARASYELLRTDAGVAVANSSGKDGNDTLFGIDRLYFSDKVAVAYDWQGNAGEVYRLYQAAFDRKPDAGGLGFWIGQHDGGSTLQSIADGFVHSDEFRQAYGPTPTNTELVTKMYEHVLHRAPDAGGIDFWVKALDEGRATVAGVLLGFSESQENFTALVGVAAGFEYKIWA